MAGGPEVDVRESVALQHGCYIGASLPPKSKTCRIRHLVSTVGPDIIAAGHPSTLNLDLDLDLDLDLGADSMSSSEIGRQRW